MSLRMRFAVLAMLGVFAVALGGAPASAAPAVVSADEPTGLCQIDTSTGVWSTGYLAQITIKNTDSVSITWRATLIPTGGDAIISTWNAIFTPLFIGFVIDPPLFATSIAPGQSWQFGYIGTRTSPSLPTVTCRRLG